MRFKGTFVLLIVCLALGVFVYFYEIKGGEQREKAKQAENQIWKLEEKDIQQIDLISPNQRITAVRHGEKEWALTDPRPLDADSEELNRLAGSASSISRESVLEENAADLAKFGLNPAQSTLRLKTRSGKEYAINFGNNNPAGSSAYAAFPSQKKVFLVSSSLVSTFNKKLDDLRNHSILSFEQPEAQSLSVKSSKGDLDLIKDSEDRWWFGGADKIAADSPGIRGMLNSLSLGKIKEFFDQNPEDYADLGLDKPFIDVRLTYGKNKAIKHLVIGAEKSQLRKKGEKKTEQKSPESSSALYLAKNESRQDLFFVEKDVVDKLLKPRNEVREKSLASFQRWDVDSIDLKNTKGSFSFAKSNGEWFLGQAKKKVKSDAINGILDALEKPVKEWIDKPASLASYGLDKPAINAVLKQGSTVIADCALGKAAKNGIYAQVKGDPSVKLVDPEGLDKLDRGESDFLEPPAAPAPKK